MTGEEFTVLFGVLDQVWGGVDMDREQGYRWVLSDYEGEIVADAVAQLAREDRVWLPKAPEIAARCERLLKERATQRRVDSMLRGLSARLALNFSKRDELETDSGPEVVS